MDLEGGETTAVLRTVVARVREQNLTFLAGSLAYNAFVSLIPLLLLLLLVVGAVGSETFAAEVTRLTESYLTAGAQQEIQAAVDNAGGEVGISVTGVLVLLWGALKLFRGLDTAFAEVYQTDRDPNVLKQFRDGLVALLALVLSLAALALAGTAFAYFRLPLLHVLNPLLLLAGLSLAFLPMYYVFPDVDTTVREALPGAVVAAGGWAILEVAFQVYASFAGRYEAYGVIGGVILLLTWLYFGGFVLLVGAAVNAVIRERERARLDAPGAEATLNATGTAVTDAARTTADAEGPDGRTAEAAGTTPEPEAAAGTATANEPEATAEVTTEAAETTNAEAETAERAGDDGESEGEGASADDPARIPTRRRRVAGRGAPRRGGGHSNRNVAAAFAVGVVVGLVSVLAAAVRFAR